MRRFDLEKKLGAKIAYLRKSRRFSQEKLAEKADISEIYVGEIERGDANPTLEKLKLIANALDVEISELFDFSLKIQKVDKFVKIVNNIFIGGSPRQS